MSQYYLRWSFSNTKLVKIKDTVGFGLPAYKSNYGETVCHGAGLCKEICYARQGNYVFKNVKNAREFNLLFAKSPLQFSKFLFEDLFKLTNKTKVKYVRIHDSGDFISEKYLLVWLDMCKEFKTVIFYTYTKMIPLFIKNYDLIDSLSNFRYCFSEGGIYDKQLDYSKCWSRIFINEEALNLALKKKIVKYNGNESDIHCINMDLGGIGFTYHGVKTLTHEDKYNMEKNNEKCERISRKQQKNK